MTSHPDDTTIEHFAIGALDEDETACAAFVAHVAGCADCSAKLQRQAILELSMMELAEERKTATATAPTVRKLSRRYVAVAMTGLAAAAAVTIYAGRAAIVSRNEHASARPVAVVSCPDGAGQAECIAAANRNGSSLEYPNTPAAAAFGARPGTSVMISVLLPQAHDAELEGAVNQLREPIAKCINDGLTTQTGPTITGEFMLIAKVTAEGKPSDIGTRFVVPGSPRGRGSIPPYLRAAAPCAHAVLEGVRLPQAAEKNIELDIHFVWRE